MDHETNPASDLRAVVVLSGGQDSTTCLFWSIDRFGADNVHTVTFDYGQRHRIEIDCAQRIAAHAGVRNCVLPIDTFSALGGNALTDDLPVSEAESESGELPNTFVPGRNLIFLTYAAAYAWQHNINNLVTGVAQTDYSGYPDCRSDTMAALQDALRKGMERPFEIHTPLMNKSKRETVELARDLDALDALGFTHTCYNGTRPPCGTCPACVLRAKGFAEAGIADPLLVQ